MSTKVTLILSLLLATCPPERHSEKTQNHPPSNRGDYVQVEIRGKLEASGSRFYVSAKSEKDLQFNRTHSWFLIFDDASGYRKLASELKGKTVLVKGELAVDVDFHTLRPVLKVYVTSLKLAEK